MQHGSPSDCSFTILGVLFPPFCSLFLAQDVQRSQCHLARDARAEDHPLAVTDQTRSFKPHVKVGCLPPAAVSLPAGWTMSTPPPRHHHSLLHPVLPLGRRRGHRRWTACAASRARFTWSDLCMATTHTQRSFPFHVLILPPTHTHSLPPQARRVHRRLSSTTSEPSLVRLPPRRSLKHSSRDIKSHPILLLCPSSLERQGARARVGESDRKWPQHSQLCTQQAPTHWYAQPSLTVGSLRCFAFSSSFCAYLSTYITSKCPRCAAIPS